MAASSRRRTEFAPLGDSPGDWDPAAYGRFSDLRLRPALDLLARVGEVPEGEVVDLGCGGGAAGPALRRRFAGRHLTGVDLSPAMLAEARARGVYDELVAADISAWAPDAAPALFFSNAALHWLPDHERLLPRLVRLLRPGGVLAVQMPRQFGAPSHQLLHAVAHSLHPDRFPPGAPEPPVTEPEAYLRLLAPFGAADVWESVYLQRLAPVAEGHPVRAFTASTAARPVLDRLSEAERRDFLAACDAALAAPYPAEADGSVLFPFRRLFIVLRRV
jgi:trans-aconitate 2-methyltransferase